MNKKLQNTRASAASERSDGTTEATRNNTKPQETQKKNALPVPYLDRFLGPAVLVRVSFDVGIRISI